MIYLEILLRISDPLAMVLDRLILFVLLFSINYFYIDRPMARQIEAHYHSNLELVKSNEMLERFFAISDLLIAYLDTNFNFIRVNKAYSATDQRPPEAFVGKNHFNIFPNSERRFRGVLNQTFQHSILLDSKGQALASLMIGLRHIEHSREVKRITEDVFERPFTVFLRRA